jgi:hypothetical protein
VDKHQDYLSFIQPKAGAIAYVKYFLRISSTRLAERLLREKSTLVVPGDQFGMDHYLRIGYGCERERLLSGLGRVGEVLSTLYKVSS